MIVTIEPAQARHYAGQHAALAVVAAEKKYLALTQAPPLALSVAFYEQLARSGMPHYVALDADRVVGWCDVAAVFGQSRAHIGVLGIGLLPAYRRRGVGAQLLAPAIAHGWRIGLTRIELAVRADNPNAIALYQRFGFAREGVIRRGSLIDGDYQDLLMMGLLRDAA